MTAPPRTPQPIDLRIGAGPIWAAVYAAMALIAGAGAVYLHVIVKHSLLSHNVLIPALVSVWFAFRAYLAFNAKRRPRTSSHAR